MGKALDLENRVFGRLKVIKRMSNNKHKQAMWLCECSCVRNNSVIVVSADLVSGHTSSCGCLQSERTSKAHKKYNIYNLNNDFGIGFTNKNEEFYFDLEDYDKINKYCWRLVNDGYVACETKEGRLYFHRIVMGLSFSDDIKIDHENRIRYDNKKQNLRIATPLQNAQNIGLRKNNKSGITGVQIRNDKNGIAYISSIKVNKKEIHLSVKYDFESAVYDRLSAEKKYFGEFAPQKHLFEKYGV